MYAKPKRGKTAQGEWKDIVNVKDYTQTLRMEKCLWVENVVEVGSQLPPAAAEANDFPSLTSSILEGDISFAHFYVSLSLSLPCRKPGGQCSYVSHHYKSQCSQVYNYHRLLSWNKERGLHMDIYKVNNLVSVSVLSSTNQTIEGGNYVSLDPYNLHIFRVKRSLFSVPYARTFSLNRV